MAAIKTIPLTADQYSVMQFFTSLHEANEQYRMMCEMGWSWAREGTFASWNEGPTFYYQGGHTRHNIAPWKKADGRYVWRCTHPQLVSGDSFMEFETPVACAMAQEIQSGL